MEHDADTGSEEITEMFCELCKKKGKSRTADGFCVDCVRYLCSKCLAYHTEFLPDHSYQDKKTMPQDVCLQQCLDHADEIIKFYCTSCNAFFCSLCKKKDHHECEDVNHLPQLVCQLEKGKEFQEFKSEMESLDVEIRNIESGIETDKESIELISRKAVSKIESTRKKFLEQLNGGFDKLIKEVMAVKDNDKKAIESNSSDLSKIKSQMRLTKLDIEKKQGEARRCELFMSMKGVGSNRKTFQDNLNKMKERTIKRYDIQMKDFWSLFGKDLQLGKLHWEDVQTKSRQSQSTKKTGCKATESSDIKKNMAKRAFGQNVTMKFVPANFPDVEKQKSAIANQLQRPLIKGEICEDVSHEEVPFEEDLDPEEIKLVRKEKEEQMMKEKMYLAVLYVQRLFRAKRELRRLREAKSNRESTRNMDSMFEEIKVDEKMCSICGVFFDSKLDERLKLERSMFVGGTLVLNEKPVVFGPLGKQHKRQGAQDGKQNAWKYLQDNQFESSEYQRLLKNIRTQHMQENGHLQKLMELNTLRNRYRQHIAPKLMTVNSFLNNAKYGLMNQENVVKNYAREQMAIERMKRKSTLIEKAVHLMMKSRMWSTTAGCIEQNVKELETDFAVVQPYVEETYHKLKQEKEKRTRQVMTFASAVSKSGENWEDELDEIEEVVDEPAPRRYRNPRNKRRDDKRKTYH